MTLQYNDNNSTIYFKRTKKHILYRITFNYHKSRPTRLGRFKRMAMGESIIISEYKIVSAKCRADLRAL